MPGVGTKLIAPTGHRNLSADRSYYYLGRYGRDADAMLCTFEPRKVFLEYMQGSEFERALACGRIEPSADQRPFPTWLYPALDKASDPEDDFSWEGYKKRNKSSVKKRYKRLKKLLAKPEKILSSRCPLREVGRYARKIGAHENRVACDFFLAYVFGSRWALLSRNFCKGTSKRSDRPDQRKRGPKHKARGPDYGWPARKKMREKMYRGYERFAKRSRSLPHIWRKTLTRIFKCKTRLRPGAPISIPKGKKRNLNDWEFYHPKGKPFPTIDQFRYHIYAHFGRDRVRRDKNGEQHTRNKKRPSEGSFTESVSSIGEHCYADGYFLTEVPQGALSQSNMKPMCVVHIRDAASGIPGGIGFSIGGESAEAYRMALFCMAIQKSRFGELMGLKISDDEWPIVGLPAHFSVDRGPGAIEDLAEDSDDKISFLDIAPSYAPQSKAVIESVNPRNTQQSGAPTFVESALTYTRLAQREILRTVRNCQRIDVGDRLTPDMKREGVQGHPLSVFNYLDENYRNHTRQILFEDAVRSFLRPVEVTITKRGAKFYGVYFNSKELRKTHVLDRAVGLGNFTVKGYTIPLCLRQIWLDVNGTLVECYGKLALRDNDQQLNISQVELIELDERRRTAARLAEESRYALDSEFEQRYEDQTGEDWDGGTEKRGRPKTGSVDSRTEFANTKKVGTGGRG